MSSERKQTHTLQWTNLCSQLVPCSNRYVHIPTYRDSSSNQSHCSLSNITNGRYVHLQHVTTTLSVQREARLVAMPTERGIVGRVDDGDVVVTDGMTSPAERWGPAHTNLTAVDVSQYWLGGRWGTCSNGGDLA